MDGVAGGLGLPGDERAGEKQDEHCSPDRPAMSLVLHHTPQIPGQRARDREDREHLQEIGQWRRILEGVCSVGIDIAAAIGAEHLDRDLRSHRALHDGLRVHDLVDHDRFAVGTVDDLAVRIGLLDGSGIRLQRLGHRVRLEVLDHALRDKHHGEHQTDWHEQVIGDARDIDPEIADRLGRVPGDAAHQRGGDGDAGGGGREVVQRQPDHLREIRHGRFAAVELPVGVGGKARGGVEGEVRRQTGEILRVKRKMVLVPQDEIGEQHAHEAEQQHGNRVAHPALLLLGIDAAHPVGQAFHRPDDAVDPRLAVGIEHFDVEHPHQVQPERLGDQEQDADVERELGPGIEVVHEAGDALSSIQ